MGVYRAVIGRWRHGLAWRSRRRGSVLRPRAASGAGWLAAVPPSLSPARLAATPFSFPPLLYYSPHEWLGIDWLPSGYVSPLHALRLP